MDLLQLKYFQTVARHQHMTRAAEELHIAQSSLSKTISRLEENLNVKLFERHGRQIILNEFGKKFLRHVDNIFLELENGRRELELLKKQQYETISIITTTQLLPPACFEEFLKHHKNVRFHQSIATFSELRTKFEKGDIDFCISSPPFEYSGFETIELMTEEILLAVPENHRFAERDSVHLKEVKNEPFVALKKGYSLRDISDTLCSQAGFAPDIVFESDLSYTLLELIKAGMGIGFYTEPIIDDLPINHLKLLHIEEPLCSRIYALSWKKDRYLSEAAKEFGEFTISYFKSSRR